MPSTVPVWISYRLAFEGKDADQHRIEAHPTGQSIEGLSWALALALNYGISGRTRYSRDLSKTAKIFITPPQKGSVFYGLDILVQENPFLSLLVGGYTVNAITPYINSLIGYVFGQAMNLGAEMSEKYLVKLDKDDLNTISRRIEPPLTRAHTVIGRSANEITLSSGRDNVVTLNEVTKENLKASPVGKYDTVDTNVTSFNVLTGNGRMYSPELEATLPLSLGKNYYHGTTTALIQSMEQYSLGNTGTVRVVGERVETPSGRLVKYIVTRAEEIPPADWVGGVDPLRMRRT